MPRSAAAWSQTAIRTAIGSSYDTSLGEQDGVRRRRVAEGTRLPKAIRTWFALAFSSTAAAERGSTSMARTDAAPSRAATIAHSPEPEATSTTRRPATSSG